MKTKRLYQLLLMLTLIMSASMCLTACGDDDEQDDNGNIRSRLVGTWKADSAEGWGYSTIKADGYTQFKSDGSYIDIQDDSDGVYITRGTWSVSDSELKMKETEGDLKGTTYTSSIIKVTSSELIVESLGFTVTFVKVSDNEINKYLK